MTAADVAGGREHPVLEFNYYVDGPVLSQAQAFDALRGLGPFIRSTRGAKGYWVFTEADIIRDALQHPGIFSSSVNPDLFASAPGADVADEPPYNWITERRVVRRRPRVPDPAGAGAVLGRRRLRGRDPPRGSQGRQGGLPSFHTNHWDPVFAAADDADLPLCMHFGSGGTPSVAPDGPFTAAIALFGLNSQQCTVELVNSRIFERFGRLKVALSEGGIGWIPYILERCDYTWERHRWYTGMEDARRPSEIFRDHLYGCFIADDAGLRNLDLIGVDNVMFECDYPHSDSNWPHTRKMLAEALADVPDDVARKIAEDNARRLYNFPRR